MKLTQSQRILRHLQDYGTITTWQAIEDYGITRLSASVFDLKEMGYKISGEVKSGLNRYGEKVSWKEYRLEE